MLDDAFLHNPAVGRLVELGDELIERELAAIGALEPAVRRVVGDDDDDVAPVRPVDRLDDEAARHPRKEQRQVGCRAQPLSVAEYPAIAVIHAVTGWNAYAECLQVER